MSLARSVAGLAGALALSARLTAQTSLRTPPYAEYRVDVIDGRGNSAQAGVGITIPMGLYVRLAAIGAMGPEWRGGKTELTGRTDIIGRFLLDPFRQMPVALSMGGGVTVPYERGATVRPLLAAVIDIEGKRRGGLTPALQVGLGGGARVGLGLRTSVLQRR